VDWDAIAAGSAAVGALGSALGAAAAWRAASSSARTARDANEAIALVIHPVLVLRSTWPIQGDGFKRVLLPLTFMGGWPARDVKVEIYFTDGTRKVEEFDRVEGSAGVEIAHIDDGASPGASVERVIVRWSDDRRLAQYEAVATLQATADPLVSDVLDVHERRIA
jgi:hypothetical protein